MHMLELIFMQALIGYVNALVMNAIILLSVALRIFPDSVHAQILGTVEKWREVRLMTAAGERIGTLRMHVSPG
jgi:hypothetical protein